MSNQETQDNEEDLDIPESIAELGEFVATIEGESGEIEAEYQKVVRSLQGNSPEKDAILRLFEILKDSVMPALSGLGDRTASIAMELHDASGDGDESMLLDEDANVISGALMAAASLIAKMEQESTDDTRRAECAAVGGHLAKAMKLVKDLMVEDDDKDDAEDEDAN